MSGKQANNNPGLCSVKGQISTLCAKLTYGTALHRTNEEIIEKGEME
jgi:hypothetical protein